MSEKTRKSEFEEAYNDAWGIWSPWQEYAKSDLRAKTFTSLTSEDWKKLTDLKNGEPITNNLVRRMISIVTGVQRRNRMSIKYEAQGDEDRAVNEDLTKISDWIMTKSHGYHVISSAFAGAMSTGLNLINQYPNKPQQSFSPMAFVPMMERVGYNAFLLGPTFNKQDLSDCPYGILRKKVSPDLAMRLLPDRVAMIKKIQKHHRSDDGKFPNMPNDKLYGEHLLNYDEFQKRISRTANIVVNLQTGQPVIDPNTGQWLEIKGNQEQRDQFLSLYPILDIVKEQIDTVEVIVYLDGHEVGHESDPWGIGDFSFSPIWCYFDPDESELRYRIRSMARDLKDVNRMTDKKANFILSVLFQQAWHGMDVEENTLVDPEQAWQSGPAPRIFKDGKIGANAYRDRTPPDVPQGVMLSIDQDHQTLNRVAGQNEEMAGMGKGTDKISGLLSKLRMSQGLVGQTDLLDNLDLSQELLGTKQLKLIQRMPVQTLTRILNRPPAPGFKERGLGMFDAITEEGMLTTHQRNVQYAELVKLKEIGAKVGDPFPAPWSMIMKWAPSALSTEFQKAMQEQEAKAQQQQAEAKQNEDIMKALTIKQIMSTIESENTQSLERSTQAQENRTGAALDRINTMTKIDELRTKPLIELAKIAADLEKARIGAATAGANNADR